MAINYKTLGQVAPAALALTTLYTTPEGAEAVVSTLCICNQGVSTKIRVAVRPAGAPVDPAHYLIYDSALDANQSLFLTLGITLAATDVVSVYAGTGNVSFNLFGQELVA